MQIELDSFPGTCWSHTLDFFFFFIFTKKKIKKKKNKTKGNNDVPSWKWKKKCVPFFSISLLHSTWPLVFLKWNMKLTCLINVTLIACYEYQMGYTYTIFIHKHRHALTDRHGNFKSYGEPRYWNTPSFQWHNVFFFLFFILNMSFFF